MFHQLLHYHVCTGILLFISTRSLCNFVANWMSWGCSSLQLVCTIEDLKDLENYRVLTSFLLRVRKKFTIKGLSVGVDLINLCFL